MIPTLLAPLDVQLARVLGLPRDLAATTARELQELKARFTFHELEETAIPSYTHRLAPIRYGFLRRLQVALALQRRHLSSAGDSSRGRVLDFGCGSGLMTLALHRSGLSPIRCDIRPAFCLPAAQACSTALNASEDFAGFAGCVALDVLEHLPETELHSFMTAFRPGTLLVVSGPTENWLYRLGRRLAGFKGGYHQRNIYAILDRLQEAGWSRVERDHFVLSRFFCPAFVVACLRKVEIKR